MKLVPADAKLQKKSTPQTHAKLIPTKKITNLYEEVCTFLDTVERAWQATERMHEEYPVGDTRFQSIGSKKNNFNEFGT